MICEDTTAVLLDRFKGLAAADDERRLEQHLAGCADCRATAESITRLWADLGTDLGPLELDVPHERMRARFHAALAAYEARGRWPQWLFGPSWLRTAALRGAVAAALLLAGVVIGRTVQPARNDDIADLRAEVRTVGLALLEHQSASERLLGVAWAERAGAEPQVVNALLERVDNDPNVSVRLAAIEALRSRLDRPEVSAGLATALEQQEAPLLQVTLANALLETGDARGVAAVRRLHDREGLDPAVRDYLDMALQSGDTAVPPRPDI
jgi:predicted anti-sigma-YlaC factor YlaD